MEKQLVTISNGKKVKGKPQLSIVMPVYKNDPSRLLLALAQEINLAKPTQNLELVVVDDGSAMPELSQSISAHINTINAPAKFISLTNNSGRANARNVLIANSSGDYLLFLDSDMLPDSQDFIANWLEFIKRTAPSIAYGGFSMLQANTAKEYDLARALAARIDCLNAEERTLRGPLAVATSNLLVRRDIMVAVPFDSDFVGWGWEDVDWALRANAANYSVVHIDIAATHLGIDMDKDLLLKFQKAGPNFRQITQRHPEMMGLESTKAARILSKIPVTFLAPISYWFATCRIWPTSMRAKAARFWRAIWAAISLRATLVQD